MVGDRIDDDVVVVAFYNLVDAQVFLHAEFHQDRADLTPFSAVFNRKQTLSISLAQMLQMRGQTVL